MLWALIRSTSFHGKVRKLFVWIPTYQVLPFYLVSYKLPRTLLNLHHSLGQFSRWQIGDIFLIFQKTGFCISCKLSPWETICMKCQILFSGKNKKNILICHLPKFYPECKVLTCRRSISDRWHSDIYLFQRSTKT